MSSGTFVTVDWDYDVPAADVAEARLALVTELEKHYHTPVAGLTDLDVARYLVRTAQPAQRYLRNDGWAGRGA